MGQLKGWQFWLLNVIAAVALALVVVNVSLSMGNRTVQTQALERQQFINQSMRLSRLNNQLIRALATISAQSGDQQIRDLLAAHGITFNINQGGDAAAAE